MRREISYAGHNFIFEFDENDATGNGSIDEIVIRNEYQLDRFINMENKVFIDIGSAIGVAAIIMAKLNPNSRVLAFEPYPKSFDNIVHNAEINKITNLSVYNIAVSNNDTKKLTLHICPHMSGANSTHAISNRFNERYKSKQKVDVNCISFDQIVEKHQIESIELLKIDCEGAEFEIIYDSETFKQGIVKNITGEFHDLSYNNTINNSDELIEYCKKYIEGDINMTILRR